MKRSTIAKLIRLHILTPGGLFHLTQSFLADGISLMALIRFSSTYYPDHCALVNDGTRLTYKEAYEQAQCLAQMLYAEEGLRADMYVGILCRNHLLTVLLLPALSRLGVHIKLINTDIAPHQLKDLIGMKQIRLLICDHEMKSTRLTAELPCRTMETEELCQRLTDRGGENGLQRIPSIRRGGDISIYTGGSSGTFKEASRRMNIFQFLPPLFALLNDIHIDTYGSVLLSLPVYHGFGLATLAVSLLMGKKVCLTRHFHADEALHIISNEEVEVLPLVPAMLARLWQTDDASGRLKTVRCIICGGNRLDRKWIDKTRQQLGDILFNLYGTTEAGFFMMATPQDILAHEEEVTIGRPIRGVKCKVENTNQQGTGSLWVCSSWAMTSMKHKWQNTGDMVWRHPDGCYFYRGRTDNMVVCGGENAFPEHVEEIINSHPDVINSFVHPASDALFGTILDATIELRQGSTVTSSDLKAWLSQRLSRSEMPHHITISPISLSATGKVARTTGDG